MEKFDYIYGEDASDDYPLVHVSIEWITPDIAKRMLETNVCNRDKKQEPIAEAIRNGEWEVNGETIKFSWDGVLRDGQNRLQAIANSGIACASVIVRGVDPETQDTMDVGVRRQICDYLKMKGYKEANVVASIGGAMARGDKFGLESSFVHRSNGDMTVRSMINSIEGNYESRIKPVLRNSVKISKKYKGVSTSTAGTLLDRMRNAGAENYACFVGQLTGEYNACKSVRLLISRLNDNAQRTHGRLPQKIVAAFIVKAWNAYMRGDDMKQLKFTAGGANPESFPELFLGW